VIEGRPAPERLRSSQASRFAARKNGPSAAGLTVRRRLGSSERQPESGSATRRSLRCRRISAAADRDRSEAVLLSPLIVRLKVGPIRPQPLRRSFVRTLVPSPARRRGRTADDVGARRIARL
jgi:hypothetical protein